jgi:hypothetical protein
MRLLPGPLSRYYNQRHILLRTWRAGVLAHRFTGVPVNLQNWGFRLFGVERFKLDDWKRPVSIRRFTCSALSFIYAGGLGGYNT